VLAYAAVALVVALVTAIAAFPYGALETRLESMVREQTGARFRLEETGYSLPFGLEAERAFIGFPSGEARLELTEVDLQWRPWAVLAGKQRFVVRALSCGGRMRAAVRFDSLLLRDKGAGSLELRDMALDPCASSLPLGPVSALSGRLAGEILVSEPGQGLQTMSGNASLTVEQGGIAFGQGRLQGLALEEARLECRLRKEGDRLRVAGARLTSPGMEGSLSGVIRLKQQLEESALDLQLDLDFSGENLAGQPENPMIRQALAGQGLRLLLQGTAARPSFQSR